MYSIYHNSRCKTSRAVLEILTQTNQKVEIIDYQKTKFTISDIEQLLQKLNLTAIEVIRKNEDIFKKHYKGKNFSADEWIRVLVKYPKLLERPIVIKGYRAIVCRPIEKVYEIINN